MKLSCVQHYVSLCVLGCGLLAQGCQTDDCVKLCQNISSKISTCQQNGWSTDWKYLDATSRKDYENSCIDQWSVVSSQLEWREIQQARNQCADTFDQISSGEIDCDFMRANLYYSTPE